MTRDKNPHGQYFTPATIAEMMVSLVRSPKASPVLEPCSGEGVFLGALDHAGFTDVTAVEIDPVLVKACEYPVINHSFVNWKAPRQFSTIIGNPPYIRWRDLDEASRTEVQAHRLYRELFNSLSDYLTVFIAGSIELLAPGGELIFITPSFWMHTAHSGPLREWLLARGAITDVVDFGESRVFDGVASAIVVFRFEKGASTKTINHHRYVGGRRLAEGAISLSDKSLFTNQRIPSFSPGDHWTLATTIELAKATQLEERCRSTAAARPGDVVRLGEFVDIANGMVSGLDRAFRIDATLLSSLNVRELEATFAVLKAAQISPISSGPTSRYINLPQGLTESQARSKYPHLICHLEKYQEELEKRYSYQRELPFWEWAFKRSEQFFLNGVEKGFVPCKERLTTRTEARFTLAASGVVATQDVTAFAPKQGTRESVAYIVAYLAQPIVTEWLRLRGLMKGGVAEFSERPLANIPFRAINWDVPAEVAAHQKIVDLVRSHTTAGPSSRAKIELKLSNEFTKLLA